MHMPITGRAQHSNAMIKLPRSERIRQHAKAQSSLSARNGMHGSRDSESRPAKMWPRSRLLTLARWLILMPLVLMLCVGCAALSTPYAEPVPPASLPQLPPLNVVSSKPMPACFLSAISNYLSTSEPQPIEQCLSAIQQSTPTTR